MARKTKAEIAAQHAAESVRSFEVARDSLAESVRLLKEDEAEHRAAAAEHTAKADEAREVHQRHERLHGKLSDLLS